MHIDRDMIDRLQPRLRRGGWIALVLAIALCALAPHAFFRGYLAAYVFWMAVPLGAGALLLVHALGGGRWGLHIRGLLAAMVLTMPLFILLFLPIAGGVKQLYAWSTSEHDPAHGAARELYLNLPFFFSRAGVYLLLWAGGAWLISQRTRRATEGSGARGVGGALAAIGMILYVLTVSFAAIDWVGTLDAQWYSSIFGLYLLIGQVVAAMALAILAGLAVHHKGQPLLTSPDALHDLGTLLLAFVALHAYIAFSQYFIIWNGNLPHEIGWYLPRMRGFWGVLATALMLLHFGLPFAILLSRTNKRTPQRMIGVALVLLGMRFIESIWMVIPSAEHGQAVAIIAALVVSCGIGCAWVMLAGRALLRWHLPAEHTEAATDHGVQE